MRRRGLHQGDGPGVAEVRGKNATPGHHNCVTHGGALRRHTTINVIAGSPALPRWSDYLRLGPPRPGQPHFRPDTLRSREAASQPGPSASSPGHQTPQLHTTGLCWPAEVLPHEQGRYPGTRPADTRYISPSGWPRALSKGQSKLIQLGFHRAH